MDPAGLPALQEAIRLVHGCESTFAETASVREALQGRTAWEGEVQVLNLKGHATASRCYAWSHATEGAKRRFHVVLHEPPVDSPSAAVRAALSSAAAPAPVMQRPPEHETTRALARRSRGPQVACERPYLIGVRGEHAGRFFPVEGLTEVLLGRASDCAVSIMLDENVSRRQARVAFDAEGNASICDLESLNGTLLNGTPVTHPAHLRRGDRIYVGDGTIFKFDYFSDEERSSFQAASLDPLTECFNRGFLEARIQEMFHLARSRAISLSVIFIDVDHFKQINDSSGHQAGDYALQQMADVVMRHLEANAVDASCYRYGGEEFVVLLPACGDEGCRRVAEGLRADVAATRLEFEGAQLAMTISLGTATLFPAQFESATALIGVADANCLRAKRDGRNRVVS